MKEINQNVVPLETRETPKPMIHVDYENAISNQIGNATLNFPSRQEAEESFAEIYDMEIQSSIIDGEKHALNLQQEIVATYTQISGIDSELPAPSAETTRAPEEAFKRLVSEDS